MTTTTEWRALAAEGKSIHGEADLVCRFEPGSVLDAGCGTGRVAIELAARGIDVVGVDLDPAMLDHARLKAPSLGGSRPISRRSTSGGSSTSS